MGVSMKPIRDGMYLVRFQYKILDLPDDYEESWFMNGSWHVFNERIDPKTIQVVEWWHLPEKGTGHSA